MSLQYYFDTSRDEVIRKLAVTTDRVLTLVTHFNPHHDELVAFVLFLQFYKSRFPNLQHVCFDFCRNGEQYRGKDFDANLQDGYLCVGVGGGPLDEHGGVGVARKKNKCSADLVAEYLGIQDLYELQFILEYTRKADLNKVTDPTHSANAVKRWYRQGKIFNDTFVMIREQTLSILLEQQQFFSSKEDFDRAVIEQVARKNGKFYKIVSGVTDNPYFAQYARSEFGCHAAIIIQMNSKGNVQISSNSHNKDIYFPNIVGLVRLTELKISGYTDHFDWVEISTKEKFGNVDVWYYHPDMGSIMNGSETHPDVPPTKLSMEVLRNIVKTALTPEYFAEAMEIINKSALAA